MDTKKLLTIAGSDCSGGAGVQADIKTFSAFWCYSASVITAVVAENTQRVISVYDLPAGEVGKQLDAVFEDISFDGVKLGMLPTADIVKITADKLSQFDTAKLHIVCDPVLTATGGETLSQSEVIPAYVEKIFPIAELITPNIAEAEAFTGVHICGLDDMETAANKLREMGAKNVLIKGGHLDGDEAVDFLLDNGTPRVIRGKRIDSQNTHGTGCTLSSAITAGLADGCSLFEAVRDAKRFVDLAIQNSYTVGKGHSPVNHFCKMW